MRFFLIVVVCSIISCAKSDEEAAAIIDHEKIMLTTIDSTISGQLYNRLYDIYYNRKIALDHIIEEKLIAKEAINRKISVDSLLQLEIYSKFDSIAFEKLLIDNDIKRGIPNPEKPGTLIDPFSREGLSYVREVFYRKNKNEFIGQLKTKFGVTVLLSPPFSSKIHLGGILSHSLSDIAHHSHSIIIISDFECDSCQDNYRLINDIMTKYKDKISFRFTYLSDTVNYSMLFSECLSKQIPFKDIYPIVFKNTSNGTIDYQSIVTLFKIDMDNLNNCINSDQSIRQKINASMSILKKNGVAYTPSLIIDGRLYYGEFDIDSISEYIDFNVKLSSNN